MTTNAVIEALAGDLRPIVQGAVPRRIALGVGAGMLFGSVAKLVIARAMPSEASSLRRRAEQSSNEVGLSLHVVRWCVRHLALTDHSHHLIASNRL